MAEPVTTTSAAFFWGMFGGLLMTMFGITPQAVMCAVAGAALYTLAIQESPSDAKGKFKVLLIATASILCSAIAASSIGDYLDAKKIVINGMSLAFAVTGPWAWKKLPELFSQVFNKYFPK